MQMSIEDVLSKSRKIKVDFAKALSEVASSPLEDIEVMAQVVKAAGHKDETVIAMLDALMPFVEYSKAVRDNAMLDLRRLQALASKARDEAVRLASPPPRADWN